MRIGYRSAGMAGNRLIASLTRTSQREVPTIGGSVRIRPVAPGRAESSPRSLSDDGLTNCLIPLLGRKRASVSPHSLLTYANCQRAVNPAN